MNSVMSLLDDKHDKSHHISYTKLQFSLFCFQDLIINISIVLYKILVI